MADQDRAAPDLLTLSARLEAEPWSVDLFYALRLLEAAHRERPRLGESARAAQDAVRLGQTPSLAFAPSTLASYGRGRKGGPPRLSNYAFGLFGPNGPLPLHLTDYANERVRYHRDPTLAAFADVFHHRLISLFYRAWAAAEPTVSFDRPQSDRFAGWVASLIGLGMASLRERDAMPDLAKLFFAGRLAPHAKNAEGLAAVLGAYFALPVRIEQFVGGWLELPERARWRLGGERANGLLGQGATVGAKVWSRQHKFRIIFGPLGLEDYERLLPGGATEGQLMAAARNYVGDELAWDVNLVLRHEEVPPLRFGRNRLGWTSWLGRRPTTADADDLLLDPVACAARVAPAAPAAAH